LTSVSSFDLWVADITCVPTQAGLLHRAIELDALSRRVIGLAMKSHLRTDLVPAPLASLRRSVDPPTSSNTRTWAASTLQSPFGRRWHEAGAVGDA